MQVGQAFAAFIVCDGLNSLPHMPRVIFVDELLLDFVFVEALCLSDASLQTGPGC